MARDSLPVVEPAAFPAASPRADATVWGVVLAAGTSSRYGEPNKLLASLDGRPLVAHAVETLVESDCDGVTVVVGWEHERVTDAVAAFDVEIVENPAFADGQSTSVRRGVERADAQGADAVLVALGDMPDVDVASVDLLVEAYERGVADVLAAAAAGQRGNPVLFDAAYFDALAAVEGDTGGRSLLTPAEGAVAIETGDYGVHRDVDRPADLTDIE
jgi:molybdenum cofactor cytidylyltransferase